MPGTARVSPRPRSRTRTCRRASRGSAVPARHRDAAALPYRCPSGTGRRVPCAARGSCRSRRCTRSCNGRSTSAGDRRRSDRRSRGAGDRGKRRARARCRRRRARDGAAIPSSRRRRSASHRGRRYPQYRTSLPSPLQWRSALCADDHSTRRLRFFTANRGGARSHYGDLRARQHAGHVDRIDPDRIGVRLVARRVLDLQ